MNSQIYYLHKIEIANSRNMKICTETKLGVLNPNLWSEISYQQIFKISKTRPLIDKVLYSRVLFLIVRSWNASFIDSGSIVPGLVRRTSGNYLVKSRPVSKCDQKLCKVKTFSMQVQLYLLNSKF